MLLSLPVLWALLREEEAEEYAINYFEEELAQNSSAFNELHVCIFISQASPNYQVFFEKDSKKYFVNFNSNCDRLQRALARGHSDCKVTY